MPARHIIHTALVELFRRLTSRKLWMVIVSCSIPWLGLERGVNHLYALDAQGKAVYGGMFLCVMAAITAIVCKYMGIENVSVSAATSVTGAISAAAEAIAERRDSHETRESHEVLETIEHVVDEGAPGAPERRPWTQEV
jgi:hypothetical protein